MMMKRPTTARISMARRRRSNTLFVLCCCSCCTPGSYSAWASECRCSRGTLSRSDARVTTLPVFRKRSRCSMRTFRRFSTNNWRSSSVDKSSGDFTLRTWRLYPDYSDGFSLSVELIATVEEPFLGRSWRKKSRNPMKRMTVLNKSAALIPMCTDK